MASQGVIVYISSAWGGCSCDEYLIEYCGIPTKLLLDSIAVLACCGFDIADSVGAFRAQLHIPAYLFSYLP